MALFYIHFTLKIKQRYPEKIHEVKFYRHLEDEYRWEPIPQIGSTILIPFFEVNEYFPSFGPDRIYKTPCEVVDIIQELNGLFSYSKIIVFCEAKCDLLYFMENFGCDGDLEVFRTQLKDRGWSLGHF